MSTETFKKAITDLVTKKVILTTVTLSYDGPTTNGEWPLGDIHMIDNTREVTSQGIIFQPYGLTFAPPSDSQGGNPTATLQVDDIDQILTANFRSIESTARATISIILADTPDQVEMGPLQYIIKNTRITGSTISISLEIDSVLRNNLSGFYTDASYFPGLFL